MTMLRNWSCANQCVTAKLYNAQTSKHVNHDRPSMPWISFQCTECPQHGHSFTIYHSQNQHLEGTMITVDEAITGTEQELRQKLCRVGCVLPEAQTHGCA
jgi:hypothetical protein